MYFAEENIPTRFYYDDNNQEVGWIEVRTLDINTINGIQKKATKKRIEYKRGQRFEVVDTNEKLSNEMVWDFCICNWDKVVDKDGKKEVCNKENKIRLMNNSPKFMNFVSTCIDKLDEDLKILTTDLEKN